MTTWSDLLDAEMEGRDVTGVMDTNDGPQIAIAGKYPKSITDVWYKKYMSLTRDQRTVAISLARAWYGTFEELLEAARKL
jgi:hypothetical protein